MRSSSPPTDPPPPPSAPTPYRFSFVALSLSCASAAVAETVTYPIDAVKTQLQLQSSAATKPKSALQLARQLGVCGLSAGLSPAVLRHVFYSGTRITLYEQLRSSYAAYTNKQQPQQQQQDAAAANASSSSRTAGSASSDGLLPKLVFGLTAGGVGQLVAVPADLIKVQMQADVRAVMSGRQTQRRYTSIGGVAAALVKQHGVTGLWRGGLPAVQRAALINLGELSTYDEAKQAITQSGMLPPGLPTHLASSLASGFVSACISTPVDVIKTRLMAQAVGENSGQQPTLAAAAAGGGTGGGGGVGAGIAAQQGASSSSSSTSATRTYSSSLSRSQMAPHYKGMIDCAVQTVRLEGWQAMYKGFFATWARLGPWQLCFWVTYEQLRTAATISSF